MDEFDKTVIDRFLAENWAAFCDHCDIFDVNPWEVAGELEDA